MTPPPRFSLWRTMQADFLGHPAKVGVSIVGYTLAILGSNYLVFGEVVTLTRLFAALVSVLVLLCVAHLFK